MYNHVPPFPYPWEYSNKGYKFPTAMELARFMLQSLPLRFDIRLGIYHLPSGELLNANNDLNRYVLHEVERLLREQAIVYQATNPGEYPCWIANATYIQKVIKAVKLLCPCESYKDSAQPQQLNY